MLKDLINSFKRTWRLKKVSKNLSQPYSCDITELTSQLNQEEGYLNELFDICQANKYSKIIISQYNVTPLKFKSIYKNLMRAGAGQYAGAHFVAASSLVYPPTLKFLVDHYDGSNFSIKGYDNKNSSLFIAYRLIKYFEDGESNEVTY